MLYLEHGVPKGIKITDLDFNYSVGYPNKSHGDDYLIYGDLLRAYKEKYWIATRTFDIRESSGYMTFRQYFNTTATNKTGEIEPYISSRHFWNVSEGDQECNGGNNLYVLPVVELNAGLKVEWNAADSVWEIK